MPIKATAIATTTATPPSLTTSLPLFHASRSLWPKLVVVVVMVRSHKQRARQPKKEREQQPERESERVSKEEGSVQDCRRFRVQIVVQLSQSTYFLRSATISASFARRSAVWASRERAQGRQAGRERGEGGGRSHVGVAIIGRRWRR